MAIRQALTSFQDDDEERETAPNKCSLVAGRSCSILYQGN